MPKKRDKVYFDSGSCAECGDAMYGDLCHDCVLEGSYRLYKDMLSTYSKANKVLIIAHRSNWRRQTGYKVVDLKEDVLLEIVELSEYIKVYREGRKFYAFAASHDVPMGSTWELIPRCYNGSMGNRELAYEYMKKYER